MFAKTFDKLKFGVFIGALFKKTKRINKITEAIIMPLILINAFLGLVIFLILSPL